MSNIDVLLRYVLTLGPHGIWIIIILYLVTHPEVAEKWGAILARVFSRISQRAERAHVAWDIQGRVNRFSKVVNKEVENVLPYGVRIEWVREKVDRESFFTDGKIIVRMFYHSNQDENVVRATMEYIHRGLIPEVRSHIDGKVHKAMSLLTTKKLLLEERKTAVDHFYRKVLDPERNKDPEVNEYCETIDALDGLGFFTRILLKELQDLGRKMHLRNPQDRVRRESKEFLGFLRKVATKEPGIDIDPTFEGEQIRTSIVFVARAFADSIEPHLRWINKCKGKNIDTIYLCARGENIRLANLITRRLASNGGFRKLSEESYAPYPFARKRAVCIRYILTKA